MDSGIPASTSDKLEQVVNFQHYLHDINSKHCQYLDPAFRCPVLYLSLDLVSLRALVPIAKPLNYVHLLLIGYK